jgi:lipopolysaccharide export system permease protein
VRLLDRFIGQQLLDTFLLGVLLFSMIAFFSNTLLNFIQDIQNLGVPWDILLVMIGLQLPRTIGMVLPAASFLSVLLVFSQLNGSFQITAMRMNGISLKRLMLPALALGVMASALAYGINDYVVPYCNQQTEALKREALSQGKLPVGRSSFLFEDIDAKNNLRQLIYVGGYHGNQLSNNTIIDLTRPNVMQVIQSSSGQWFADRWEFTNGNAYTVSNDSDLLVSNHLDHFTVRNLLNLGKITDEQASEAAEVRQGLSARASQKPFIQLFNTIKKREALGLPVVKKTYLNLWEKLTLPLSCVVIILTAVPLALTHPRSANSRGFVFALGVLFLYYLLRSLCFALGQSGAFSFGTLVPLTTSYIIAAWLPLVVTAILGLMLIRRKSKVL